MKSGTLWGLFDKLLNHKQPWIFVSHSNLRMNLCEYFVDLVRVEGCTPIVVERLPNLDTTSPGQKVDYYMRRCNAGLVIATRDCFTNGEWIPSQNVMCEIALLQKVLHNRVVYLREKGVRFPSNISVPYITFSQDSIPDAIIQVIANLRALLSPEEIYATR